MIQKIVVLIILSGFFISCRCNEYYSNSDAMTIEGKLIDIECQIYPNVISTDPDHIKLYFNFKETIEDKIDWESIKVYPIINKDTLKRDPIYSKVTYYKYHSDKYRNSKLNLSIKYKLVGDSFIKEEIYKDLEKKKSCRWSFTLH